MSQKPVLVQKYGGSSVSTVEKLQYVAKQVVGRHRDGSNVVVVVSAMGDTTDALLAQAHTISKEPNRRELDMLLTVGERISMSLLALAIRELGEEAVSLTGSQSGIITTASHANARIMEVRPFRIQDELQHGRIVIVAGYQGVSYKREITTLGRGGSDTTAVALAAALDAEACEIYSDVDGVLSADPRIIEDAKQLDGIGYEEMQEMAASGAKVLNTTAVEFAKQKGIAIYAKKTGSTEGGTIIRKDVREDTHGVRGVAHDQKVITIEKNSINYGTSLALLSQLQANEISPKFISHSGESLCLVFGSDDLHQQETLKKLSKEILGPNHIHFDRATVSLIGEGITHTLDISISASKASPSSRISSM